MLALTAAAFTSSREISLVRSPYLMLSEGGGHQVNGIKVSLSEVILCSWRLIVISSKESKFEGKKETKLQDAVKGLYLQWMYQIGQAPETQDPSAV